MWKRTQQEQRTQFRLGISKMKKHTLKDVYSYVDSVYKNKLSILEDKSQLEKILNLRDQCFNMLSPDKPKLSESQLRLYEFKFCEKFKYNNKELESFISEVNGSPDFDCNLISVIADGVEINHLTSINPSTKELSNYPYKNGMPIADFEDGKLVENRFYPDSMSFSYDNKIIMEW